MRTAAAALPNANIIYNTPWWASISLVHVFIYTHCMMDLIYIHVKHISKAYRVYPVYIGDLMFSCRIRSIIEYVLYRHGNVSMCIFIYKNKYINLLSLECETFIDYLTSPLTGCDTMYCSIYTLSNLLTSLLTSLKKRCHIILSVSVSVSFFYTFAANYFAKQTRA